MSGRNLFASILMTCLLAVGLFGIGPVANAASAGQSFKNPAESVRNNVIEIKRRHGDPRIYQPIGPGSAHDYAYYYSRGYYPRHIGPGYIYYGFPYFYSGVNYSNYYERDNDDDDYADVPSSAKERCARRFRSFDWDTGLYTTYGGKTKLCPYLR